MPTLQSLYRLGIKPLQRRSGRVSPRFWATVPSVDQVGSRLVFNIGGNKYRLIAVIDYVGHGLLIRFVGTHAEYDRIDPRSV